MASKRVKFNQIVEKAEFEKLSSEEEDEGEEEDFSIDITDEGNKNAASSSQESLDEDEDGEEDPNMIISDEDEMASGHFIRVIKNEQNKAMKERRFLMKEIRAKERRGSIFIDEVNKVVAAVQREAGKYDYLIEWKFNKEDKLVPTTSLVKGSHFVFSKPLLYRRYVEQ